MKVLFLNPPFHYKFSRAQRSPAVTKGGTIYYPIWLAYATGVVEQAGYEVKLIDAPPQGKTIYDILNETKSFNPDIIIIDTSTPSILNDVKVGEKLKDALGAFVVLVGTHVSALPEETLKLSKKIDAIAVGEYDYTILELVETLQHSGDLSKILGISYQLNGKIYHNPKRPFIENLDELPFVSKVYKKHLNVRDYFYTICKYPEVTIITGRGCPYRCHYCVYPQVMFGHKYRKRSVENIVQEFEYIVNELPEVKEIFIEDDTFTIDKERVRNFSKLLLERGIKISWTANARFDVDYETLKIMHEAGCRMLCVGFESGDNRILRVMGKGLRQERAFQFVKDAQRAGILVHGCFMAGNPGETKKTLEKTLEFAIKLNPDTAQFFPIMVYPGTRAYEWANKHGYLTTNDFSQWVTKEGLHNCVVSTPYLSNRELVEWCDYARRKFYLRPQYIAYRTKRLILHPEDSKRILKSFKTFVRYLFRGTKYKSFGYCSCV